MDTKRMTRASIGGLKTKHVMNKYFMNDLNVQRFSGIFSATYCWPKCGTDGQEIDAKCWSQVMVNSYDWFMTKMWTEVVAKVPIITNDDSSVQQINELLFALILKELDLLTVSQMRYFETVLDLFNDEISFGVLFWLKLCSQFNWRLVYTDLISQHKHSKELIHVLVDEIEANASQECLTEDDIQYYYSLIDCICVHSMTTNIIDGKLTLNERTNNFYIDIQKTCQERSLKRKRDICVQQLATFNVMTQELIGFGLNLLSNQQYIQQDLQKLTQLENLFSYRFVDINDNFEIFVAEDLRIRDDIAVARNNYQSLELMNSQFDILEKPIVCMKSLDTFFKIVDNKAFQTIRSKRFSYLSRILRDEDHPNFGQTLDLLFTFGNYQFLEMMAMVNPQHIHKFELTTKLTKKLVNYANNPTAKCYFKRMLFNALKDSPNVDLKTRIKNFGTDPLVTNEDLRDILNSIKTRFNQITESDNELIEDLIHDITVASYFMGIEMLRQLLELVVEKNKAHQPFVSRIIAINLNPLTTNIPSHTLHSVNILLHLLMERLLANPSIQTVDDLTQLVKGFVNIQTKEGLLEDVLSLQQFFLYLMADLNFSNEKLVYSKLLLMKNIIELSGNQEWPQFLSNLIPTILFLIQYLDYYWHRPHQKQITIDVLNMILDTKMVSNFSEEDFALMDQVLMSRWRGKPGLKATTPKIYLIYLEKRFPKPIEQLYDISNNIFHDQILHYSAATLNTKWITDVYPQYAKCNELTKIALDHIMPALTEKEFNAVFKFLFDYYYGYEVISMLQSSIRKIKDQKVDKIFYLKCLMNLVNDYILQPIRDEIVIRPISAIDYKYYEVGCGVTFKSLAIFDCIDLPTEVMVQLEQMLTELAQKLKLEMFVDFNLYTNENLIPRIAKEVLRKVFNDCSNNIGEEKEAKTGMNPKPAGAVCSYNSKHMNNGCEE
ncbi:uncharacterized protein LOC128960936 [Oppia nitens]|uniref:uncharacterized protein LOC128960936 n=1 Tax=Oppia nitens TaxID=1686743 RepID=UPI0023DA9F3C|nr:uncharacterized protein LOC128960936 [Oppia nitens]